MLERWTRAVGVARRLHARVNVGRAVGTLAEQRLEQPAVDGDVHPPALANGSTAPVARCRRTQRCNVATPTSKRAATAAYASSPASYARTARVPNAVGYGFGMHAIDHRISINSSECPMCLRHTK